METSRRSNPEKFRRYRAAKRRQGLREIRTWVPDVRAPRFADEAARQGARLRGTPGERGAVEIIESILPELAGDD